MSGPRLSMAEKMRIQEAKRVAKDGGGATSKQDWKTEMQAAINLVNDHQQDTAMSGDASAEILAETDKAVRTLFTEFKGAIMPALAIRMSQAISNTVAHNVAESVPEGTRSVIRPALAAVGGLQRQRMPPPDRRSCAAPELGTIAVSQRTNGANSSGSSGCLQMGGHA